MGGKANRVVYKPDSMSTDEYIVIIEDAVNYKKWVDGDKTIPLVEIVDSFDVFHTGQGSQGVLARPSKQILESVFGTSKDDEVVTKVLESGKLLTVDNPQRSATKNDSMAGSNQKSHGSNTGSGHGGR